MERARPHARQRACALGSPHRSQANGRALPRSHAPVARRMAARRPRRSHTPAPRTHRRGDHARARRLWHDHAPARGAGMRTATSGVALPRAAAPAVAFSACATELQRPVLQKGAALVTALLIVTFVSVIASSMLWGA